MAVMEAMMNLFVKEVASAERILSVVRRFSDSTDPLVATSLQQTPKDAEQALLLWISMSCQALKMRLAAEAAGKTDLDIAGFNCLAFCMSKKP